MSGFSIEFWRDGRDAPVEHANRMTAALRLFGPDRQSAIALGPFAISWTLDNGFHPQDKYERQPVCVSDRWALLFLGRLNHREELAQKLGLDAPAVERMPDCEMAMQAWLKWGVECREHLYGVVTLAVCDLKDHRLIALRGYERTQALYTYQDSDRFIIASSTKAIFADPTIRREVDEIKIADMLVLNHEDTQRSYFKNVGVLGPSRLLEIGRAGDPRITFRNCLDDIAPIRFARDEDYIEQARELLDRTLDTAFRSTCAPALSLSAGLDSTSLAVAMVERLRASGEAGARLRTYTGVPNKHWDGRVREHWLGDESGPVKVLAKMYPEIDPHFEDGGSASFDQNLDMLQSYIDMPVRGVSNSAWGYAVRQRSKQDGAKLLVTGSDGNGTLSFAAAHILFAKWLRTGQWAKLGKELRAFTARRPSARISSVLFQAMLTNMPDQIFDAYYRLRGHDRTTGFHAFSAIRPEFANDIGISARLDELNWDDRYRRLPSRERMMRRMMQNGARNDTGGMIEGSKAVLGIDTFTPFGDRKLMEFCIAIPDDQFYRNGVDRRLIREMMKGRLPDEVTSVKRGEQGADWHSRRKRDLDRIMTELDRLEDVPSVAEKIDIPRLKRVTREWPEQTPVDRKEYPDYAIARYGIGRAISIARFINQVEGRN